MNGSPRAWVIMPVADASFQALALIIDAFPNRPDGTFLE